MLMAEQKLNPIASTSRVAAQRPAEEAWLRREKMPSNSIPNKKRKP